jgi:hypothetical protein
MTQARVLALKASGKVDGATPEERKAAAEPYANRYNTDATNFLNRHLPDGTGKDSIELLRVSADGELVFPVPPRDFSSTPTYLRNRDAETEGP